MPNPTATGQLTAAGRRALQKYSRTKIQSAFQACRAYAAKAFGGPSLSPTQRGQLVKFAQCLRSHGVNVPVPTFNSGGGVSFRQAFQAIDRNSPAFQSALTACRSLQPHLGRSGR